MNYNFFRTLCLVINISRNLARAVQYVTLLRGESGRVARDWLEEARLTLEARQVQKYCETFVSFIIHLYFFQAAEALVAHAASQGIAALPSP